MKKLDLKFIILLVLSFLLIFLKFNEIPKNISFDEIEFAQLAKSLDNSSYIPYSSLATGHSTLYFYVLLGSFKLFGLNNFALRFPSAFFGVASISMFYLVLRNVFHKTKDKPLIADYLPLLTAMIFITSRWYLNFARFSFEATFLIFLELSAIYFILKKRVEWTSFFTGLSFLSYTPGRLFFLLPLFLMAIKKQWKDLVKYLLIFIVIVSPLLFYFFKNPDYRIQEIVVKSPSMILENVKKTSLMFHLRGDMNGRHNFPGKAALNPILGLFFLAGFIQALKNIRKPNNQLFIGLFVISLIPTLLTEPGDNPNMLRSVTALPSIAYFSVLPLIRIYNLKFRYKNLLLLVTCLLFLVSSIYELRTYFQFQSRVMRNSFEVKCSIQQVINYKIRDIPKNCRVNKNEF